MTRLSRSCNGSGIPRESTVGGDPLVVLMSDPDHSEEEEWYLILGMSMRGRFLVVSHVEYPPRTRLISAREATQHERREYEEGKV